MPQTSERKRQYAKERLARDGAAMRAKQKVWRDNNQQHLREKNLRRRTEKRAMCLIAHARIRARRLNVAFDLGEYVADLQRRIDAGHCELTGLPFDLGGGKRQYASPSLDRVIPALGYVHGNVRVICYGMNAALGNWGEAALLEMVEAWRLKLAGNAIVPQVAAEFVRAFLDLTTERRRR